LQAAALDRSSIQSGGCVPECSTRHAAAPPSPEWEWGLRIPLTGAGQGIIAESEESRSQEGGTEYTCGRDTIGPSGLHLHAPYPHSYTNGEDFTYGKAEKTSGFLDWTGEVGGLR